MNKAPQAFRTISEVSETLDVPQHVLRFWEGKFAQIKPLKRAGGRRYYRPDDIELLRGIRALLYAEGYTIKGVQKLLRVSGARYVAEIGRLGVQRTGREGLVLEAVGGDSLTADRDISHDAGSSEMDHADPASPNDRSDAPMNTAADRSISALTGASRHAKLEEALQELLALRALLHSARPRRAEAVQPKQADAA